MGKRKERLHELLEPAREGDRESLFIDRLLAALIILNVAAVLLETVQDLEAAYRLYFRSFELFSVVVFSVEYLLRVFVCTEDARYRGTVRGRLRYVRSPMAVIDLIAILPYFLPLVTGIDLRHLRILRLFRLARSLKLVRYSRTMQLIADVLRSRREELLVTIAFTLTLMLVGSSLLYFVEHRAQPEVFSSIPAALWWGVATLSTVGYGDVYPITPLGKMLVGMIALLGIGMFAIPTGILSSGFMEAIAQRREQEHAEGGRCPHCGAELGARAGETGTPD